MPALPAPPLRLAALLTLALASLTCALAPAQARAADAAATAAATLPLRPALARGPLGNERLSDERALSRWAGARFETPIRQLPNTDSTQLAKLRFMTEDGFSEVYLVLRSLVDGDGTTWLQVRIPGRPNGRSGWVTEEQLGELHIVTTQLHVRRGRDATLRR
ncbi:MAG: ErfK/YbiS/YcfS/YnhG family protein, partial [Thermoleophilia bacterium]|nr:ErfK/YbiS/YcfS/YnhG family protein [Thermoleophilia bacterium]